MTNFRRSLVKATVLTVINREEVALGRCFIFRQGGINFDGERRRQSLIWPTCSIAIVAGSTHSPVVGGYCLAHREQ